MQNRPPIVTILGHVDHGKTTLLDTIRKSRITTKEHGGITQKIGGYEVDTKLKGYNTSKLTFIDTPGHEAFSQLRARGANVADIAILIIDAKDSLKPQTIESISHIKAANIPFIVALNKMDVAGANSDKVEKDLLKYEVITELHGGKVPVVKISALKGTGVPELLETILLLTADLNLTFDPVAQPEAYIIETKKDRRGVVVSVVIKNGTLNVGDEIYAGTLKGKVRSMIDDLGKPLKTATPSLPFELLGFTEIPDVGVRIGTASQEQIAALSETQKTAAFDLQSLYGKKEEGKKLNLIIKADSQGSLEAIEKSLEDAEAISIILSGVGAIHKSDIFLAKTTKSIVVGFAVKPDAQVAQSARQEKVVIKTYNIIYELLEELMEVSDLMREKEENEKNIKAEAKILATFTIEGEKVYGISVTKGKIHLGDQAEAYRNNNLIGKAKLISLKIHAKPVQEVTRGKEAGILLNPQLDLREGDVVKFIL